LALVFAFVLEFAEGGGFLFAAADEPGLLKLQGAELLFVDQMGVQLDEVAADSGIFLILELIGKFNATLGVDGHFERGHAAQAPGDIGERLDQFGLFQAHRLELAFVGGEMALVFGNVIGREQHSSASESSFDGVQRRLSFSFFGFWTGGQLGVGLIGGAAGLLTGFALGGATDGAVGHGACYLEKEMARNRQ